MKELVIDGDVVKRLLYNKPIINEDYTQNNISFDFRNWVFNENQPANGITIEKGKITVTKFKPNEPIIVSNFTGDASNNSPTIGNICAISKAFRYNTRNIYLNSEIFNINKAYVSTNILASSTNGYICGLGFLPYKTTYKAGRPLNKYDELPFSCYVWENITLMDDTTVQMGSEVEHLRCDAGGGYNYYGKINNYTDKELLPDWKKFYGAEEGTQYNKDFQLAIGLYTTADTDSDGFIELAHPIEIFLTNNIPVDPTTQESFKLYVKNKLIYERDKTINNLYKTFGLLRDRVLDILYYVEKFDVSDYNYSKITLPVAIDLVQDIINERRLKFNITQYDFGRNKFWETVITTINQKLIKNEDFCYKLFENAKGLKDLDWNTIGDDVLHGLLLNCEADSEHAFYTFYNCFSYCDIPRIRIKCNVGRINEITNAFKNSNAEYIKFEGTGITITDLTGAFEFTRNLQTLEGLKIIPNILKYNQDERYISETAITLHYSFEGTGLINLNIPADNQPIKVYPYCPQVFGSGAKLKTISGIIFDFSFINPSDMSNWGVPASYGHPIFGNSQIESILIKGLNKGDWNIPLPLNDTSVIYLLNNVYDLMTNADSDNIEQGSNSFNDWVGVNVQKISAFAATYNKNKICSLKNSNYVGKRRLKVKSSVATEFVITLKDNGTTVTTFTQLIDTSETTIDLNYTFTDIEIYKDLTNVNNDIILYLLEHFDSAASNVTLANLSIDVSYKSDFDSVISVATSRGWNVTFNAPE